MNNKNKKDRILEYHDYMCDDSDDISIPPVLMEGYEPVKNYKFISAENAKKIWTEAKAISFGLTIGAIYALIGISK